MTKLLSALVAVAFAAASLAPAALAADKSAKKGVLDSSGTRSAYQ